MNKCFITKLPSRVDNDNLPAIGELRIKWLKQGSLTDTDARAISLTSNDKITVKVSGAHFTDSTLTSDDGNIKTITGDYSDWLFISNDKDAILTIDNKYSLTGLTFIRPVKDNLDRTVYFDLEDIKYCTNLEYLEVSGTKVSGDISTVSKLVNLKHLLMANAQISGDISAVSELNKLEWLTLNNTSVSGDVNSVAGLTNLQTISFDGISFIGDISKIPVNVYILSARNSKFSTNFTWTAKSRQNASFLAMLGNVPFDTASMDNMLIDQATCTVVSKHKILQVSGTRTSASDAAVTAIQNMGVTITGVTKES